MMVMMLLGLDYDLATVDGYVGGKEIIFVLQ